MYKRIVLAYDGSASGQKALLDGLDIAQWSDAALFMVAVRPASIPFMTVDGAVYDSEHDEQLKRDYSAILEDGLRQLAASGRTATGEVLAGDTVEQITGYARKVGADLIVVGHKHLDGWAARWWRGSTSPALIEHAHCSVLVVITA
jgi:nucleotide-binding universal stress UspA family protein